MKAWAISDTHGLHKTLKIPKGIDILIHAGDSTNHYDIVRNQVEFDDFFSWLQGLDIKYKVIIAGNHDAWATKKYNVDKLKDVGICYLEHNYCSINNKIIFGSPYTPTFNNWHFMKDRSKLGRYWDLVDHADIVVTHGPPKGILDLSYNTDEGLEYCGDNSLNKMIERIKPEYHIFGHIHSNKHLCYNAGIFQSNEFPSTKFINASCIIDGQSGEEVKYHGHIIEI